MSAFLAFLQMGGYGGYVWSAFAVAAAVLAANVAYALRQKRRALRRNN